MTILINIISGFILIIIVDNLHKKGITNFAYSSGINPSRKVSDKVALFIDRLNVIDVMNVICTGLLSLYFIILSYKFIGVGSEFGVLNQWPFYVLIAPDLLKITGMIVLSLTLFKIGKIWDKKLTAAR